MSRTSRSHFSSGACSSRRSEEHTSELQSLRHLVCRLLLEKKKQTPEMSRRPDGTKARAKNGASWPGSERPNRPSSMTHRLTDKSGFSAPSHVPGTNDKSRT